MTGATSGEFTVWDGRTFNWESVLQVRRVEIRKRLVQIHSVRTKP